VYLHSPVQRLSGVLIQSFSLRSLGDLCVSAVKITLNTLNAETQRTQRWRRDFQITTRLSPAAIGLKKETSPVFLVF